MCAEGNSERRRSLRRTGKQDTEATDSEGPTEFGVVRERYVIEERENMTGGDTTKRLEVTTRSNDTVGIRVSQAQDTRESYSTHVSCLSLTNSVLRCLRMKIVNKVQLLQSTVATSKHSYPLFVDSGFTCEEDEASMDGVNVMSMR